MRTMRTSRLLALLGIAALLALTAAGCSRQEPAATAAPTQAPMEAPTEPPAEEAAAAPAATDAAEEAGLKLTIEELAAYDGKNGNPAYIAVDGVIYDVSGSARWANGDHNGYSAGKDLTDIIKQVSPHGLSVLSRMPVVGEIAE